MLEIAPPLDRATILKNQSYEAYLEAAEAFPLLRVEYIHGDIVMTPAPIPRHQIASANLMFALQSYVRRHKLGIVLAAPLDVELEARRTMVQPDILFVRGERMAEVVGDTRLYGPPDLVIEILSPSTARIDRAIKLQTYADYGVSEYWIVNPVDMTVEVYTLHEQGYLVAGIFGSGETITAGQFAEAKIEADAIFLDETATSGAEG